MTCMQSFLCMVALGNKTVAHTWLPSFDYANGRLCQDPEILLISLDWLSLDRRFSKIMTHSVDTQYISSVTIVLTFVWSPNSSQQRFSRADWRRVSCCTVVMWPLILNLKGLCHPWPGRMREPMKKQTWKSRADFFKFCRRFWKAVFICLNLSHRLIASEVLY